MEEKTKIKEKINWKKELISWAIIIVIAFVLAILITNFVIMKAEIVSGSMEPGLKKDDHVIGNRLAYLFSNPERGDVIFFEFPKSDKQLYEIDPELTYRKDDTDKEYTYHNGSEVFVKRIIGLPGEKVEIIDGKVYINDSEIPLEEPYLKTTPKGSYGPFYVPEGCYFVMGDNRNQSHDARFWDNYTEKGPRQLIDEDENKFRFVPKELIYAKAALKTPPDMHWIEHYRYDGE